jgi:glycyl-tRNA synthetase beta chain
MVGEFPELQGTMGAYHAAADGEHAEVVTAIREHYQPRGAGDALPTTVTGTTLALADRLDTLAGIFGIGQKPSGTKDPFALRRAAIGVLRILLEQRRDLDVGVLVDAAVALQPVKTATTAAEVRDFILERLRAHALEAGHPAEAFDAALASGSTRPLDLMARLEALAAFRRLPEAEVLAAANKRIANILRKSDIGSIPSRVDPRLLRETAERELHAALDALTPSVTSALQAARYNDALTQLAGLRPAVDAFFTEVMVNDPDPALRANRLALVSQVRDLFSGVADLSRLPG